MKFLHTADLHIGKKVNEFSMIEDQRYILDQIIDIAIQNTVDGIIIAGDIYDRNIPSVEAVELFDDFITKLTEKDLPIYIISGNHDSSMRLQFASRIMHKNKIYIVGEYDGSIKKISLNDEYGTLNIFLMPYLKPAVVNRKLETEIREYHQCVVKALEQADVDNNDRNILAAHQFVTHSDALPETSDSEVKSLGGMDNVDTSAFESFDYVALGHIHRPQRIGRDTIRYSGSPLKYSASECHHKKSVTIITLKQKGEILHKLIELTPIKDMQRINAKLEDIQSGSTLKAAPKETFVHVTLTDEDEIIDAIGKIRQVYPNVMTLSFDNTSSRESKAASLLQSTDVENKSTMDLFKEFFIKQHNGDMNKRQETMLDKVISGIEGEQE